MHRDDTAQLVDDIYTTAMDGHEWKGLLSTLASRTDSAWSLVTHTHVATTRTSLVAGHGIDARAVSLYKDHYSHTSPLLKDALMRIEQEVYTDAMYPDQAAYLNSEFYNDYLMPIDVPHLMQVFLTKRDGEAHTLLLRRGEGAGPYTEADIALFRTLTPHLRRAWGFRCSFEQTAARSDLLSHLMDNVAVGILVVDEHLKPLTMNQQAKRLLDEHRGLRIAYGRILPSRADETSKLEAAICQAGQGPSASTALIHGLRLRDEKADLYIALTPLPESLRARLQAPGAVVLQITDLSQRQLSSTSALGQAFNLTLTEARIADALANGLTADQIAAERTTTTQTIRWYIKKLLGKLEARKQSDIVKLVTRVRHTLPDTRR